MIAQDILQVIYAPHKAFKKILEKPGYLAALIVLIIFVIGQVATNTVYSQRAYFEDVVPNVSADTYNPWTSYTSYWQGSSGLNVSLNTADYIGIDTVTAQPYLNTTSIQFTGNSLNNATLELANFGQNVDATAYDQLALSIKQNSPAVAPQSVTLTLYSIDDSSFTRTLTANFTATTLGQWNNLTVPLGTSDWTTSGTQATWENITGLKLDFTWVNDSTVDILVDGVFFRGVFKDYISFSGSLFYVQSLLSAVTPFLILWLLFTATIYLIIKGLKGNIIWKPLMTAVGVAMIPLAIESFIMLGVYAAFIPNIYYPIEVWTNIQGPAAVAAFNTINSQLALVSNISLAVQLAVYVWLAALGSFIVKELTEYSWVKSAMVAAGAVVLTVIISDILSLLGF
ncbi:MAG: hypothetical protein NWF01_03135 [Candidatus Bathyarchaeota archaeon]|nr:hypothetical protein [Candidatus Bathyarchaeota archaeon]